MTAEHVDVLVVGAGLSGVGAAYRLQTRCPTRSYAIVEGRSTMGGTWDLFRYPGVRSDSDMHTLGYPFRPWENPKAIADAPAIKRYIEETAAAYGIDRKIRYQHRVTRAEWSSDDARWTVDVEVGPERVPASLTCCFLYACTGYYDYDRGYTPEWPGRERFAGRVVHPQQWPADLDYAGQRVVVIGSGATAVTLVPALAERASHVTMLQRSPSYVVEQPTQDVIANWLRRLLPARAAYRLTRWKNVLRGMFFYSLARTRPALMKRIIRRGVRQALGAEYDVDTHFAPRYNPWDERLCIVPDADLFRTLKSGRASIVTDQIDTFTETGLRLRSGAHVDADLIVTATGLNLKVLSGVTLVVDGAPVDLSKVTAYKGTMYSGVPNLASAFGYTNASWTLKCDLVAEYVCRLLNTMERRGYAACTPRLSDGAVDTRPALDITAGYVQRALPSLPRQGSRGPWRVHQNYVRDLVAMRHGRVEDDAMEFRPASRPGRLS
ncbi:cyclohexanone monooxygenase [Gemmatimonadetes bacterium T265]|nr:cyclohexanone monooxygenase [Gemmatimonadetes bacterium T265]